MFSIDSMYFLKNPLSFGFKTVKLICMFFTFRDLQDVKWTQIFATSFFWEIEDRANKNLARNAIRRKRGPTTWPRTLPMWWVPSPGSWVQLLQSFAQQTRLDLKSTIYIPPLARQGSGETWNTQYGSADYDDRRVDANGTAPNFPFDSTGPISFNNMIKRE
jgi:hypothetical protein